ncbi:protein OSB2, chloroplastic-like [Tasmannia lanceolata]|uniref:protein OSB2, chloroplastic-like n=1 Tax=Tasmannia lanceolata TaxID=3420 RepID=UPI004064ABD5
MNISRRLTAILSSHSSSSTKKCLILLQSSPYSTTTSKSTRKSKPTSPSSEPFSFSKATQNPTKEPLNWPRPSEIPWQTKVSNSVHLIGSLQSSLQFEVSPDGKYLASGVVVQAKSADFPQLWIPIIFEGDLAQIAVCHLKENDLIYVTGQLSGDPLPSTISEGQTGLQVIVHSMNFVKKSSSDMELQVPNGHNKPVSNSSENMMKAGESAQSCWRDLVDNPKQWWDYRMDKLNGLVNPRHPDFKHKETKEAVWIDRAPQWFVSEFKGLEFDVKIRKEHASAINRKDDKSEELWKDLVENPSKWWDNRPGKECGSFNPKSPDFKNKETNTALWIDCNTTPAWVLPKLPPVKSKQ